MSTEEINHSYIIAGDISKLFLSEICSDITLIADGKRFVAHKIVLAARSNTFRQMIYNTAANAISGKREIHIQNKACSLTFKNFLKYLYTGKLSLAYMSQSEIEELLSLALEYQVKQLAESVLERQNSNESSNTEPKEQSNAEISAHQTNAKAIDTTVDISSQNNKIVKIKATNDTSSLTTDSIEFENVAKNAIVYEGLNKKSLFDYKYIYPDESANTQHMIDADAYGSSESNVKCIAIMLSQPTAINAIKFQLWDKDPKRVFSYYVSVSVNKQNWTTVIDYGKYHCRSHQVLLFTEKTVQYIKIVGTDTNTQSFLASTKYLTVKSFECGVTRTPAVLRDNQFWQPTANIASVSQGSVVIIRQSNSYEYIAKAKMLMNGTIDCYSEYNFGTDKSAALLVQLTQPIYASSISFIVCGDVSYKYAISTSEKVVDGVICEWSVLFVAKDFVSSGYQRINFKSTRKVLFIRIHRIQCSDQKIKTIQLRRFSCPASNN